MISKRWSRLSIRAKIISFFLLLLFISVLSSFFLIRYIYTNIATNNITNISNQMLLSVNANLESSIDVAAEYSKMVLANQDIQALLQNNDAFIDVDSTSRVFRAINNYIGYNPVITGIYVYDRNGNQLAVDRSGEKHLLLSALDEAPWYNEMLAQNGQYVLVTNAGDIFQRDARGDNYISLIRSINTLGKYEPNIGTLIINISTDYLKKSFETINKQYDTDIAVLRKDGRYILNFSSELNQQSFNAVYSNRHALPSVINDNGNKYVLAHVDNHELDWSLVGIIPYHEMSRETADYSLGVLLIAAVNGLLLIIGSIWLFRHIARPINKLAATMRTVNSGELKELQMTTGDDEIGRLKDGYNRMIHEIRSLISVLLEEQKIKRKAELDILQAQIKPHFLYNTLETVRSFALTGKTKEVNIVLKALGSYYRNSLNKGKEVITLREEIDIVRSYLTIQSMRYNELFDVQIVIDPATEGCNMLKLSIQPFVENAIYHGIKLADRYGHICISSERIPGYVRIVVEDNGAGMTQETLERITRAPSLEVSGSFGIRSTIERLNIFYGSDSIVQISSEEGIGTKVTLLIPDLEVLHRD